MENISNVEKQDLSAIQVIEDDAFPSPWQPNHFEVMRQGMLSKAVHFLKMTDDDGLVLGFAVLHLGFPNCDLFKLAIHPDYRSRGLGKRLVNHCVNLARDAGEDTMILNARFNDHRAMSFYTGLGFVAGAVLPEYYRYEVDGEIMRPSAIVMTLTL